MPDTLTKPAILDALRQSRDEFLAKVRTVPADAWSQGRYENGWNARQILAHVASIEWTYPRLLDIARAAASSSPADAATPAPASTASPEVRRTTDTGDPASAAQPAILSYNDRQVEKHANATPAGLIAEFEKNRAATIAAVEAADESLLQTPVRSAGGITGPLAAVINAVACQHIMMHAADIAGETWDGPRF